MFERIEAAYTPEIAAYVQTRLAAWRPTVAVARSLLAPWRDRLVRIVMDDGQYANSPLFGLYRDVVHRPDDGFALLLRGLSAEADPERRRWLKGAKRTSRIPLRLIQTLPDGFGFLLDAPERWPVPASFVDCEYALCRHAANTGRFCGRCGHLCRRRETAVPGARYLGPAFAALQEALRAQRVGDPTCARDCVCGAVIWREDRFCGKCGRAAGEMP